MVEVLTKYLKDVFDHDPRKPARIRAYRGGYLPTERRETERALRAGTHRRRRHAPRRSNSASTSARSTWRSSTAIRARSPATWQRLGRAGRRQQPSLGVLVASSQALDQYVVRHPEFFEIAPPEHARIAPDQLLILLDHIRCAAFELPFASGDRFGGERRRRLPRSAGRIGRAASRGRALGLDRRQLSGAARSACARSRTATSSSSIAPTGARPSSPRSTTRARR